MHEKITILNVPIANLKKKKIIEIIRNYLQDHQQHQIATVNPEFLLLAQKDKHFYNILSQTDLNIPDGIGLKFASWLYGYNLTRYPGADLIQDLLIIIEFLGLKLAIVNWSRGLSSDSEIYQIINKFYPKLKVRVISEERETRKINQELKNFAPNVLFCTFGAPWQEEFIAQAIKKIPRINLGIGVGGSFDFLTGKTKRAPHSMRFLGLEWFWRLFQRPKVKNKPVFNRYRRIYNAFIVFSWKVLRERLTIKINHFKIIKKHDKIN